MLRIVPSGLVLSCLFSLGFLFHVLNASNAAAATTYYIAANGSDSNAGTSKSTPWLHAPGMNGCSATCAAKTPQAGDQFILRGGDTWHGSVGSPMGLNWTWTWSGSAGNLIYIGVDQTWFSGSLWARPVLTFDNPTSKSQVSSCAHDDSARGAAIYLNNVNYVQVDNFEFTGLCWSTAPSFGDAIYIVWIGSNNSITNNYFHGWTHTSCSGGFCDAARAIQGTTTAGAGQGDTIASNVIDGSDADGHSLFAVYGDCYDFHSNVLRYVSNGVVCNNYHTLHDNLFEHIANTYDGVSHTNVFEVNSPWPSNNFIYNNTFRHNFAGVQLWTFVNSTDYYFNNVIYDWTGPASNCWDVSGASTIYFMNNTIDSGAGCLLNNTGNSSTSPFQGNEFFQNNHLIGFNNLAALVINTNGGNGITHETTDIYQAEATANSQGFTSANDYAPTSSTSPTVAAGSNLTSSCTGAGNALCSGTTDAVLLGAGETSMFPAVTPNARPSSGAWDIGAYQFGSGVQNRPNPPSNLTAVVN
jgi:hypothetical protein